MPVTHEVASSSLVVPAIKRSHLVWLFLMAELIVVRIAFASSADFGKAEVNDSERNAVPVNNIGYRETGHLI